MAWGATVVADSLSPTGHRLFSVEATYPLIVHAEANKHRVFSSGSASNRAISNLVIYEQVNNDPFIPLSWPKRHKNMAPKEYFTDPEQILKLREIWLSGRDAALATSLALTEAGVHKEIANRPLGPYQWVTSIITGTDWDNFFLLRCHPEAEQHMRRMAELVRDAQAASIPQHLDWDAWHLPYIDALDREIVGHDTLTLRKISVARCARTSTLTQTQLALGRPMTVGYDLALFDRLYIADPKHAVPFEHVATPNGGRWANFTGWQSWRYLLDNKDWRTLRELGAA